MTRGLDLANGCWNWCQHLAIVARWMFWVNQAGWTWCVTSSSARSPGHIPEHNRGAHQSLNAALTADPLVHLIFDVIKEAPATERRVAPRWPCSSLYGRRSRTATCKTACRAMNGHQPPAMADRRPHGSGATRDTRCSCAARGVTLLPPGLDKGKTHWA